MPVIIIAPARAPAARATHFAFTPYDTVPRLRGHADRAAVNITTILVG
eukprot:COSAG02_NODE_2942_length_7692_cov_3.853154_10_plen_48_part_00